VPFSQNVLFTYIEGELIAKILPLSWRKPLTVSFGKRKLEGITDLWSTARLMVMTADEDYVYWHILDPRAAAAP
jgi:hypothetical protein